MELIDIARRAAQGETHKYHNRTHEVHEFAEKLATGEELGELIVQYKERETEAQKKQRVKLTNTRTKSAISAICEVFAKLNQVDARESIEVKTSEELHRKLLQKVSEFVPGLSLKAWLDEWMLYYNTIDPNAYLVLWQDADGVARPVLYEAEDVRLVEIEGVRVSKAAFSEKEYHYDPKGNKIKVAKIVAVQAGLQIVAVELVDELRGSDLYPEGGSAQKWGDKSWMVYQEPTLTTECPAMCWGYKSDYRTDRETFVTIWDNAEYELRDLVNRKSEYDLLMALHVWLQKFILAEPCDYVDNGVACNNGRIGYGEHAQACPACNGKGVKVHTTTQDVVVVKREDDPAMNVPLSDYAKYLEMPFEIVNHHKEEIENLRTKTLIAVFGVDISQTPNGSVTATAIANYYDSVYAVLSVYADHYSKLWCFCVRIAAQMLGIPADAVAVAHRYPRDFELKSVADLLAELEAAKRAGAPAAAIAGIEADLIAKTNANNPAVVRMHEIVQALRPFKGLSETAIAMYLASAPADDPDRLLYFFLNDFVYSAFLEDPIFSKRERPKQLEAIRAKLAQKQQDVRAQMPSALGGFFGAASDTNPNPDPNPIA